MLKGRHLEETIEALLQDGSYAGHPLRQALEDLYREFQEQLHQIERITRISDQYQSATRKVNLSLTERCRKQLRYLEKVMRISDGYQMLMRDRQETLKDESLRDMLTGLSNRRFLQNRLRSEQARLKRLQRPLILVLADIDRFKAINDRYGHDVGDKVLIAVARTLASGLREYDVCGRWGGEEFLVIMPEVEIDAACAIIDRLRAAIAALTVWPDDPASHISASFGIAQWREPEDILETLRRADHALLAAKRAGRNRCEVAG